MVDSLFVIRVYNVSRCAVGLSTDVPIAADFDGDGKTDIAIYRPSNGVWWILFSTLNYWYGLAQGISWGLSTDIPIPADLDGDGKADLVVYRGSNATFWALLSSSNYSTYRAGTFGLSGDRVALGDYDGDGRADIGVYRPSDGTWRIWTSSSDYARQRRFPGGKQQLHAGARGLRRR